MQEPRLKITFGAFPKIAPTPTPSGPLPGLNPLQDNFLKLQRAEELRRAGKLDQAQRICESILRDRPDYMVALHTLGLIYADKQNFNQALNCLVRAVMLNPRSWMSLTALSGIYLELNAPEMAAQTLEQARAIQPRDVKVLVTLGEIYRREREFELAKDAYRDALDIEPHYPPAAVGLGWCYLHLGQNAEGIALFESLINRGMRALEILAALANAPSALVNVDLLSLLKEIEGTEEVAGFDNFPAFARVAALDKAGRYNEAWQQAEPANRAMSRRLAKDLGETREREQTVLSMLKANRIVKAADDKTRPISLFILGPSRSGKTTMESLVGMLDGVKRGYENPAVDNAIRRAFQNAGLMTNAFFEFLPPELYPSCREIYLEELSRRAGSAKIFTNTHPARMHDAALLASVFPNVRFIFLKRDIEDIVLRMYLRRYTDGNAYSYDLNTAREHVRWYHQMMDLMAERLPERVRVIAYEQMIEDPAASLRTAAELCGIAMTDKPLPPTGDDRGCSEPYREMMAAASR